MDLKLKELFIQKDLTILEALRTMDERDRKLFILVDEKNKYFGLLSAGDIQRAILRKVDLSSSVSKILREDVKVVKEGNIPDDLEQTMKAFRMEFMPVLDDNNELVRVIYWEDIFSDKAIGHKSNFDNPVVIMAGGFGTRMKPLTNVLPKPLIPVGEHTMLEEIFRRFNTYGVKDFILTLNYKADLIKYYINDLHLPYTISYVKENKPLGTIGSLKLLKGKIDKTFFVTNCDILLTQDYSEILEYHNQVKNEVTLVSAIKSIKLPYGTIDTIEDGQIHKLFEKPEFSFNINTGFYILEPEIIDQIPDNKYYDITDLIQSILCRNGRVGAFPISENSWTDTGVWPEYIKNFVGL